MKYFKKIAGEKLYLSPLNPDDEGDVQAYTKWVNDLSLSTGLGAASNIYSIKSEKDFLQDMVKRGHLYAIVLLERDELIGNCSLFEIDHVHRTASMGLFIGEAIHRNKGYGTEAVQLIVEYGFRVLNLNNIMLRVLAFNKPALRCYQKAGFKVFGKRTDGCLVNGGYHDELFMEILSRDLKSSFLDDALIRSGLEPWNP